MRRAGVLSDVQKEGYVPGGVCWREFDGTYCVCVCSYLPSGGAENQVPCPGEPIGL